ncbi:DMT family transporter [Kitasatospora sp. NBC_01287]|uniref:DMT family transporter n=1 Tax=Kitasatospora sp. NBC_01287 TaxID=2903573 RepID=UPI002252CE70|nr:DMT family transporter [Kitasatospora sp. NBC_01287]MCX4747977.1 DMT family transporter [Kitasatospora sp. NBC_01287]
MAVLALLWGSGFLWIKLALDGGLSPLHITVIRSLLGAGVLLLLARARGGRLPRDRRTWGHLVVAAFFCNALPFFLQGIAEQSVDSGVAGVLNATTPLWSLAIGTALGTERGLGPVRVAGLLVGFGGAVLIFAPWQRGGLAGWGGAALLASSLSYAVAFAYMARYLVGSGSAPLARSAAQLLAAAGLSSLALPAGPAAAASATPTLGAVAAVVVLGVLGTGVTFHLNTRLIADEGPTAAATVGYLLPVVSVGLGAIVLGERVGGRVLAGMALVLIGVGLTRRQRRPRSGTAAPTAAGPPGAPSRRGTGSRARRDRVSETSSTGRN